MFISVTSPVIAFSHRELTQVIKDCLGGFGRGARHDNLRLDYLYSACFGFGLL